MAGRKTWRSRLRSCFQGQAKHEEEEDDERHDKSSEGQSEGLQQSEDDDENVEEAAQVVHDQEIQSLVLSKKPCMVLLSHLSSGDGSGIGIIIKDNLVLTSHGTIPSMQSAKDGEMTINYAVMRSGCYPSQTTLKLKLLPRKFFITNRGMDMTVVASEDVAPLVPIDPYAAGRMQPGSKAYILGAVADRPSGKGLRVGPALVRSDNGSIVKFDRCEEMWLPGSAGFNSQGLFAFMACQPQQEHERLSGVSVTEILNWLEDHLPGEDASRSSGGKRQVDVQVDLPRRKKHHKRSDQEELSSSQKQQQQTEEEEELSSTSTSSVSVLRVKKGQQELSSSSSASSLTPKTKKQNKHKEEEEAPKLKQLQNRPLQHRLKACGCSLPDSPRSARSERTTSKCKPASTNTVRTPRGPNRRIRLVRTPSTLSSSSSRLSPNPRKPGVSYSVPSSPRSARSAISRRSPSGKSSKRSSIVYNRCFGASAADKAAELEDKFQDFLRSPEYEAALSSSTSSEAETCSHRRPQSVASTKKQIFRGPIRAREAQASDKDCLGYLRHTHGSRTKAKKAWQR